MMPARIVLLILFLAMNLGKCGDLKPTIICKEKMIKGMESKLGSGVGNGMMAEREKKIMTNPKPPAFMAIMMSLIGILSPKLLLIASSSGAVLFDLFL